MASTPTREDYRRCCPYPQPRPVQDAAFGVMEQHPDGVLLEIPTGEGKSGIGMAALLANANGAPAIYVVPNKTLVGQVEQQFPGKTAQIFGRSEYPCLYYEKRGTPGITAEASPCYMLKCGHRVEQEFGTTEEPDAEPCPYFRAKYEARQGVGAGKVVVTNAPFFVMNRTLVPSWRDMEPSMVVVDEVHGLANTTRRLFEHHLTDAHLMRAERLVKPLDKDQANIIARFRRKFQRIALTRPAVKPALLELKEVEALFKILEGFDVKRLEKRIRHAIARGRIDPVADKGALKVLEDLVRGIPRTVRSFEYALETKERHPLNYVVAFYYEEENPEDTESGGTSDEKPEKVKRRKALFHLAIRSYFVAPVIRRALGPRFVGYSATIGDATILGHETGIRVPCFTFPSSFSNEHTRIFVPTDMPNLAVKKRGNKGLPKALRAVTQAVVDFRAAGHRSLVVTVSDDERAKMVRRLREAELNPMSYDGSVTARQAATRFKDGEGDVLVGTAAQYAEGVDIPGGIAPVIFFLRPAYPPLDDPQAQFEVRRFGERYVWKLWQWRAMLQALQVRGRNVRTPEDLGVCFFISQQFRKWLYGSLPEWLRPAYRGQSTIAEGIRETMELLKK